MESRSWIIDETALFSYTSPCQTVTKHKSGFTCRQARLRELASQHFPNLKLKGRDYATSSEDPHSLAHAAEPDANPAGQRFGANGQESFGQERFGPDGQERSHALSA